MRTSTQSYSLVIGTYVFLFLIFNFFAIKPFSETVFGILKPFGGVCMPHEMGIPFCSIENLCFQVSFLNDLT